MFLFLSKTLPPFIYPLGLSCVLIIAAILLSRHIRFQRVILILALVLLWVSSTRWVSMGLLRSLEWRYLPPEQILEGEVAVLLGGGSMPAEAPRSIVEVNSAGDRILYAAWLYNQGKISHILISSGLLDWSITDSTPAQDMATLLEMMGVPPDALWLETESRNTYENALYSAKILEEKGINEIFLVTSASHMPRSVKLFEAQGLKVTPLPTDFTVTQRSWQELVQADFRVQLLNLIPSAGNLSQTTRALKEYIGIFVYSLRGWL